MHDCDFNGFWVERETGATMTLKQHDDSVTGDWTGGRGHETLRGTFTGHRHHDGFEGDYVNHDGIANGHGRMRLEALGPHRIRFSGPIDWSGGGTQGHVDGNYVLERQH